MIDADATHPTPQASVIIPTRNRPDGLAHVLRALSHQRTSRAFEIVVVDDASTPPVSEADIAIAPTARLVRGEGRGPAAARNRGARLARGEILVFTDDDTEPAEGWVESACEFLEAHHDHVGVEGPVASPPFDPLYEHSLENQQPGAYWTANMAYRRAAFAQLSGFLEEFPDPHCEDLDLAFRAERLGPIGFADGMRITHFPRPLPLSKLIGRARLTGSEMILFARHRERFGRSSRLPPVLFPLSSALYNWTRQARREGAALLRSPGRLARFLAAAGGYLALVLATTVRTWRRAGRFAG